MAVQIVNLVLAAQGLVARQRDDFLSWSHHEERHVKADLVIAGTGRAVGYCVCTNLIGIACDGKSLEDALGTYRNGISAIAQHVAEDHVFETLLVVFLCDIKRDIFHRAQLVCVLFVAFQLLGTEATRVGTGGIDLIAHLLCQVHHRV